MKSLKIYSPCQGQIKKKEIEILQKTALHIMLGDSYVGYRNDLDDVGLESLHQRNTMP